MNRYNTHRDMIAMVARRCQDFLSSRDIEDILNLVDGRAELGVEVTQAPDDVKAYLISEFANFLASPDALYAVQSTASGDVVREKIIFERIEHIIFLGQNDTEVRNQFRPSTSRLSAIIKEGEDLIANTKADDLKGFSE